MRKARRTTAAMDRPTRAPILRGGKKRQGDERKKRREGISGDNKSRRSEMEGAKVER